MISRQTYSVPGANSLWHIDGNHSLIRWCFFIHGGIDGYSRMVVYLSCATNNQSETVYDEFRKATEEFGIPSLWQAVCFKIVDPKIVLCADPESTRLCSESTRL